MPLVSLLCDVFIVRWTPQSAGSVEPARHHRRDHRVQLPGGRLGLERRAGRRVRQLGALVRPTAGAHSSCRPFFLFLYPVCSVRAHSSLQLACVACSQEAGVDHHTVRRGHHQVRFRDRARDRALVHSQ